MSGIAGIMNIRQSDGARFFRFLGLTGVLFFFASAFTPLPYLLESWLDTRPDIERADAIIVLADYVSEWGALSDVSAARADHAIILYQRGLAPLLVFSGVGSNGGPTEAGVRAALARARGVPAEAILMDIGPHNTRDEARREWALLHPREVRKILLVTHSLHMLRARPVFARAGFEVHPAPVGTPADPGDPETRLAQMGTILKELLAWVYYRGAGFI